MRKAKNTVDGGLVSTLCYTDLKNANSQKRSKIEKRRQGLVRHFFQKSMKLKMWNYIHQSTRISMRNTKNTVEWGLACVVCEIDRKNVKQGKRLKIEKRRKG